jgi:hypothetical protein
VTTGDPNRKAFFGFDIPKRKLRVYSFDSFKFPSCDQCNNLFAMLEANAKRILTDILDEAPLDSMDWHIFLDWLDKIRIGLWLGYFYLNKNRARIRPKFHITARIGTRDRFVIIYRARTSHKGINIIGGDSLGFQYMPSCFTLRVNNYFFFNVSNFGLVNRRLGYPFPKRARHEPDFINVGFDIVKGFERTRYPVVRKNFAAGGSFLCQAIFKEEMQTPGISDLFNTEYVKSNSIAWDKGFGAIFQELGRRVSTYPESKSTQWIPPASRDLLDLMKTLNEKTLDYQVALFSEFASTDNLTDEGKKNYKRTLIRMRSFSKLMKYFINKQISRLLG